MTEEVPFKRGELLVPCVGRRVEYTAISGIHKKDFSLFDPDCGRRVLIREKGMIDIQDLRGGIWTNVNPARLTRAQ